jgi:signal transduction histidine kinase
MAENIVQRTIVGLIAVAIMFILAVSAMGYASYKLADVGTWTIHTHKVIEELKDSLSGLQDVETGERGFAVTGVDRFLEPYNWGKTVSIKHLETVLNLTTDNVGEQKNIQEALKLARSKIAASEANINAKRKGVVSIKDVDAGKSIMDAYRVQMAKMIGVETNLLAERTADFQHTQTMVSALTGILSVLIFGLLSWVYKITSKGIEDEKRRVKELNAFNIGLQNEIAQRVKTEKALKETTVKLTSSNTDLQQFAYVASHDLQEPLRAVSGFLTLIMSKHKGKLDPETESWINHAVEGSQRMRSLINDLLVYARVESRGKELTDVDCNAALTLAKKDLSVVLEETEAEIVSDNLPHVLGDVGQLGQLLQNLIGNAVKFRGSNKPVVKITVERKNNDWQFAVKDNGIGFDIEHADRIFVIFQRLQGREEYKGTGIGLALCKKIVERHGGRIWAESEKGSGSTFFFTIPVLEGELNGK